MAKGSFDTRPTFTDSFPPCALSITHSVGLKVSWMCSAAEIQTSVLMPVCTAVTLIEFCPAEQNRPTSVSLCADTPPVGSFSCLLKAIQGEAAINWPSSEVNPACNTDARSGFHIYSCSALVLLEPSCKTTQTHLKHRQNETTTSFNEILAFRILFVMQPRPNVNS